MKTDYLCMLLHISVVSLHCTEVIHAAQITLTVLIAIVYASLSAVEVYKLNKEHRECKHEHTNKN